MKIFLVNCANSGEALLVNSVYFKEEDAKKKEEKLKNLWGGRETSITEMEVPEGTKVLYLVFEPYCNYWAELFVTYTEASVCAKKNSIDEESIEELEIY